MSQRELNGEDIEMCNECIKKVYPNLSEVAVKTVDVGISEKKELDLGDLHLKLYPRDSIHSRDTLVIYIPEEKAMFIGDADGEDCYHGGKVDRERLLSYMQFVRDFDFDYYFMGHDLPDNKEGVLQYLKELLEKAQ